VSGCSCGGVPDDADVVLAGVDVDCASEEDECGEQQTPAQTQAKQDRATA